MYDAERTLIHATAVARNGSKPSDRCAYQRYAAPGNARPDTSNRGEAGPRASSRGVEMRSPGLEDRNDVPAAAPDAPRPASLPTPTSSPLALRGTPPRASPEELTAAEQFRSIGLAELDQVRLLDRIDTKWFFHRTLVPELLARLKVDYFILETAGARIATYDSLYFDTPELAFYRQHHNKQKTRLKVRFRQYVESNLAFAEVKHKTNTGRSVKHRKPVSSIETELGPIGTELLSTETDLEPLSVVPTLRNTFARLTLARADYAERVTIDLGLGFVSATGHADLRDLAVVELKQAKRGDSPVANVLSDLGIKSSSLSKYCLGVAWTIPHAKRNNFKRLIQRLVNVGSEAAPARRYDVS